MGQRPPHGALFTPTICMADGTLDKAECHGIQSREECVKGTCSASDAKYQSKCSSLTDSASCTTQFVCTWTAAHPCKWGPVPCKVRADCSSYESIGPGPCYCIEGHMNNASLLP